MTNELLTQSQADEKAKEILKNVCGDNWTISYMSASEADNYIWSYLFDNGLQYAEPIKYGKNEVALCHQSH